MEEIDMQVQKAQRVPNWWMQRGLLQDTIIIKMPKFKDKQRILKAAREKQTITYKGVSISLLADFSKKPLLARRDWQKVFNVMKSKDLQPGLLYPAKLSFRMEGQIKCFPNKVKLKEFIISKTLLHEMLKGLI